MFGDYLIFPSRCMRLFWVLDDTLRSCTNSMYTSFTSDHCILANVTYRMKPRLGSRYFITDPDRSRLREMLPEHSTLSFIRYFKYSSVKRVGSGSKWWIENHHSPVYVPFTPWKVTTTAVRNLSSPSTYRSCDAADYARKRS